MAGESEERVRVEVSRDLGLADVVGLGVGAMVGAGIFVLLAPATQVAGLSTILALAISGIVVLLSAASYAELASIYPRAGGGYTWVKEGLPAPSGFLAGWTAWAGHSAALALSAMSLSAFVLYGIAAILDWTGAIDLTALLSNTYYVAALKIGAFLIVLAFISTSSMRSRVRARRLPWGLIIKTVLILAFMATVFVAAFVNPPTGGAVQMEFLGQSGWAGIPLAIAFMFVAYEGHEIIALSATEVKQPHKTIPRGIIISVGLVVLLYVLLESSLLSLARYGCSGNLAACTLSSPRAELSLPSLALGNLGAGGGFLLLVAGVVAMTTAVGNNLSSATRLSFVMAKDGALFRRLGDEQSGRLPNRALLASGLLSSLFILILDIPQIAMAASILYLILFALVDAALIAIHRRDRETPRGFRVPLVPVVPAIGFVTNLLLAGSLWIFPAFGSEALAAGRAAWYVVLAWIIAGMLYHFFAGGKEMVGKIDAAKKEDLSDILATGRKEIDLQRYRVFLPLREFADVDLVKFGAQVAKERGGELSLLNVVEIPRNLPPKAIKFSFVNDRIKELQKLTKMAGKDGVDARASVKIGHKVYEIIVDTLSEEDVNLLVLGWRGGRGTPGKILGSNLDYLIETAPCDVVVFKTSGYKEQVRRLMLVAGPSFTLEGISDLALMIAKRSGAEIKMLVLSGNEQDVEREVKNSQPYADKCKSAGVPIATKVIVARDLEAEVRREAAECDVVLMSSPTPRGTRRLMLSPLEERLAKVIDKPVILLRTGIRDLAF